MVRGLSRSLPVIVLALALMAMAGCSGVANEAAPVALVATIQQDVQTIDILNLPTTNLGTILIQAIEKGTPSSTTFLDVQLVRYRVAYRRTDGGTQVPASFVKTIS